MKIANITCSFRNGDGIGNACRARARGLLSAGHEVLVITPSAEPWPEAEARLHCHTINSGWLRSSSPLTSDLWRTLQSSDLLIVDFGSYSLLHAWVRKVACPFVLVYHGLTPAALIDDAVYKSGYLRSVGDLRQFPTPDLVIGDSAIILREYEFLTGQYQSPRRVIPLFGRTRTLGTPPLRNDGILDLLCVGRIYPNKNYEVVIDAVRLLKNQGVPVRLRIIGGGADPITKQYRQRLKHLAKGLEGHIEFLGQVSDDVLDRCYSQCTVVVIPSLHEGFTLPAVEALMHGKSVVASRLGALPETLGDAAVYFDPFDTGSLVVKLLELAKPESALAIDLSERAHRRAAELSEESFVLANLAVVDDLVPPVANSDPLIVLLQSQTDSEANARRLLLSTYEVVGTRLTGEFLLQGPAKDSDARMRLRVVVIHEGLVSIVEPPISARWVRLETGWRIPFAVQLFDAGDWTEIVLMLYDCDRDVPCSEIIPCWITSEPSSEKDKREFPLASLAFLSRQCFEGRVISTGSELGWSYRLKAAISNPLTALVYNLLISPQIALVEAIIERIGSRSLPRK